MAGKNNFSPIGHQMLDSRDSSSNSGIIGDILFIVERDIQIGPDKDLLTLQVGGGEVSNALLGHADHPSGGCALVVEEGSEVGGHVEGEERVHGRSG